MKTVYYSDDGRKFNNEEDCKNYESKYLANLREKNELLDKIEKAKKEYLDLLEEYSKKYTKVSFFDLL